MNKKILVVSVIVLILLAVTLITKNLSQPVENQITNTIVETAKTEDTKTQDSKITGSIMDLLKLNKPLKCAYTGMMDKNKIEGTTYISGKNVRGEYSMSGEDNITITGNMISDGMYVYTWTSAFPQGVKMKITETDTPEAADKPTSKEVEAFKNNYDFECDSWNVDSTKFELPKDITFNDMSQILDTTNNSMCQACNYIQDTEAKAACLKNLNCAE